MKLVEFVYRVALKVKAKHIFIEQPASFEVLKKQLIE